MNLRIAICDDDPAILSLIKKYCEQYSFTNNIDIYISTFSDSSSLLEVYDNTPGAFHILFLDVEMPNINGIELASRIRELPDKDVRIVFVSAYPEYMKNSFSVNAFQYITKPIDPKEFNSELSVIIDKLIEQNETQLLIHGNEEDEVIFLKNLIYIKATNSKQKSLDFFLANSHIQTKGTILEYEDKLREQGFVSPCRGYLVNMKYVRFIRKKEIVLTDNTVIPLSRRKEAALRDYFNQQLIINSFIR